MLVLQHRLGVHTTLRQDSATNSSKIVFFQIAFAPELPNYFIIRCDIGPLPKTQLLLQNKIKKHRSVTLSVINISSIQCEIQKCLNLLRGLLWWCLLVIPISRICCISVHGRILRRPRITIWIISLGRISIIATIPLVLVLLGLFENSKKNI